METARHEIIGAHPAPDNREQMGRFLRHAFPLGVESFTEIDEFLDRTATEEDQSRSGSGLFRHENNGQH